MIIYRSFSYVSPSIVERYLYIKGWNIDHRKVLGFSFVFLDRITRFAKIFNHETQCKNMDPSINCTNSVYFGLLKIQTVFSMGVFLGV